MTPRAMDLLAKSDVQLAIEAEAGAAAGFPDAGVEAEGARIVDRAEIVEPPDAILEVRSAGANPRSGDARLLRSGQTLIGFGEPLGAAEEYAEIAARGVTSFAMELIPRITRAQSMDAL